MFQHRQACTQVCRERGTCGMRPRVAWDSVVGRQERVRVVPTILIVDEAIGGWELLSTSFRTIYHQPRQGVVHS